MMAENKYCKLKSERLCIYLWQLTVEIYWPSFKRGKDYIGAFARTVVIAYWPNEYRPAWHSSFSMTLLGFGVGASWKHWDNPNIECGAPEPSIQTKR